MTTDRDRIAAQKQAAQTPDLALHRALSRLRSTITVMNTGAHPDDEHSGLLAWLRFGLGMRTVIACSTRGEGGQNALGPERSGALGVLRSREMEEAARVLDADIAWLGHGPDDPVHDFGFSKDGDQTFARWGEARVVERMVRAYRQYRPDIVIPTFLDVPGQHGHHRAMTRAAFYALELAASQNAFPEQLTEGLRPWRVAKFYLPAWSGGGATYDDEVPPPPVTLLEKAVGVDPATGIAYDHIGEWSRWFHASQGMGKWIDEPQTEWPLHLISGQAEQTVFAGLPRTLGELANGFDGACTIALRETDELISAAIAAFPERTAIVDLLTQAALSLADVRKVAPEELLATHGHRLERKATEIDAALFEAADLVSSVRVEPVTLTPGANGRAQIKTRPSSLANLVHAAPILPQSISAHMPADQGWAFDLPIHADAPLAPLFYPSWSSLGGNGGGWIELSAQFGAHSATILRDFDLPFSIQPASSVSIEPGAIIVPLDSAAGERPIEANIRGAAADLSFNASDGWSVEDTSSGLHLIAPAELKSGRYELSAMIGGKSAYAVTNIAYPHIGGATYRQPASLPILVLDLHLPHSKVGYVSGGADNVAMWLRRIGVNVAELGADDLAGNLSAYSTIIVGIFAFGQETDLDPARLRAFVEAGGHLVTLYHRPSDGWDPDNTPPRRLVIGSPSLRWRVTDPQAQVTVLDSDHPLLTSPNRIGPEDWRGWNKERGLYFASEWDPAYKPLLAMSDTGEAPLTGSLLSGNIGNGRHTHIALVLHHQLDRLTSGAFRLLANLIQPA